MRAKRGSLAAGLLTAILLLTPMSAAWALSSDYWWVLPLRGANAEEIFGAAVSGAGDVNGDGYADVIVGAPSKTLAGPAGGRAFLYLGGAGFDTIPALTMDPGPPSFGSAVSGAGDVNGDGYADWIVGAPGAGDGLAYLYFGGSAPDAVPDVMLTGPASDSEFGFSVAALATSTTTATTT